MSHYSRSQIDKLLRSNNHYQVLGISSSASQKQIKQAYKDRALKYHPDKTSIPQAKQLFNKVANAYEKLSDTQQKATYDADLANKSAHSHTHSFRREQPEQKKYESYEKREFKKPNFSSSSQQNKSNYDKYFKPPPNPYMPKKSQPSQNQQEYQQGQKTERKASYKPRPLNRSRTNCTTVLFLLLCFFIFWSIVPNYSIQPKYQFVQFGPYSHKMKTSRYRVNYWIRSQDEKIQLYYITSLERQCEYNMNLKEKIQKMRISNPLSKDVWKRKQSVISYKACKKLLKLIKKYPLIKLTKFPNLNWR